MTSMRRRYVALTSVRRHVPGGNLAPLVPPTNILNLAPTPQYSKPSYAYVHWDSNPHCPTAIRLWENFIFYGGNKHIENVRVTFCSFADMLLLFDKITAFLN